MTDAGPRGLIPGSALAPSLRRPVAPSSVASFAPLATASTPETTQLAPEEQAAFEAWLKQNNVHDIDDPRSHYDYRGAFKAGIGREPGAEGHFPDTFKQHGHETFSGESQYSKGPGDGGTWQGDTFIPPKSGMRPSAAAEPLAKGPLGPLPPAPPKVNAPYGMRPGVRHLLPGISPRQAERKTLSVDEDAEFVLPDGSVIPMVSRNPRDEAIVKQLGQSLSMMAATPQEQAVARAVEEWGRSVIGQKPIEEIEKRMSDIWDHNVGNVVKRDLGKDRIAAARANMGGRVPAQVKYDDARNDKWLEHADKIIESERKGHKLPALNELDTTFGRMERLLSEGNPTGERVTQMLELLALTGKASRESEQEGITASAGKWDEMANKINLWTNGGKLTENYKRQFMQYIRTERANILKHRKSLAIEAASAAQMATEHFGSDVQKKAGDYVYRRMFEFPTGGKYVPDEDQPQAAPPPRAAAAPRAPAPKAEAPAPAPKAAAPAPPKAAPAPKPAAPPAGAAPKPGLSKLWGG